MMSISKCAMSSTEIKETIFDILLEFQTVCNHNGIVFYLSGGTLLGAIRHRGFIPWDDDIDVCLPRPDYERLIELNRQTSLFPDYLKLVCFEEGTLSYPFMKILDTRTSISRKYLDDDISDSLWIDVFPVEGLPEKRTSAEKVYKKAAKYRKLFMLSKARAGTGKNKMKSFLKLFLVPIIKLVGTDYFLKRLVMLAKNHKYDSCNYVGVITWGLYGLGERMEKKEFQKAVDVVFEGHSFKTMSCWESYLSGIYGNYMELPPENQRQSHDMKVWMEKGVE